MNLIPSIGTKGIYRLLEPFNTLVDSSTNYTCKAVRSLQDLIANGVDPKSTYYTVNQLTDAKYDEDLNGGVCIVSLMSDAGSWVYVPSSYIAGYPNMSGNTYTGIALLVKLAPISDKLSLTALKNKIIQVVTDEVGVDSTIQSLAYTASVSISEEDHARIEAARLANITESTTDNSRLLALQNQVAALQQRNQALEAYILENQ